MNRNPRNQRKITAQPSTPLEQSVRVRLKALEIPPVKDGVVIGRNAPMGAEAMLRTLTLMSNEKFQRLPIRGDDVISDVIVRESIMRKMTEEKLREVVLSRIRPLVAANELVLLDMDVEVSFEDFGTAAGGK